MCTIDPTTTDTEIHSQDVVTKGIRALCPLSHPNRQPACIRGDVERGYFA